MINHKNYNRCLDFKDLLLKIDCAKLTAEYDTLQKNK